MSLQPLVAGSGLLPLASPCLACRLSRRPTKIVGCTCVWHRPSTTTRTTTTTTATTTTTRTTTPVSLQPLVAGSGLLPLASPCLACRLSRRPTKIVGCTCVWHRPSSAPWQPTPLSGVLHMSNVHLLSTCPAFWSPEPMQTSYICLGAYSVRYCPPTVSTQPLA